MTTAVAGLTPAQQELRRQGIGASEVAAVVGVDPYKNRLDIYLEKTGQAPPFEGNEFTHWGKRLEDVIAEEYADRCSVTIKRSDTIIHPSYPWALCTPDRLVLDGNMDIGLVGTGEPNYGLECKNRNHFNSKAWGPTGTDEVPLEVAAQCHWSMEVTGLKRWDVAVLLGGNRLGIYTLHYNPDLAAALVEQVQTFWHYHVLPRVMPELDGSESATNYLNEKWKLHGDALKPATAEITALALELRAVRDRLKSAEGMKATLENQIKDFIGEQAGILLPGDGGKITWKRPKASVKTNWKMVADGLKSRVTAEVYETLVNIQTTEEATARRFLCQFKEDA